MAYEDEVLADAPNVWYRMREASGALADSSGNGLTSNSGLGAATYNQAGPIITDGAASKGISFDGVDDTISTTDNALIDLGDVLTIEAWVKRNSAADAGEQKWLSKRGPAYFVFINNHSFGFGQAETAVIVTATVTITDTDYHHLVATKNGATTKLYQDAVDVTGTVTNATLSNNTDDLWLASEITTNPANVTRSEVALYPTALSAARVEAHYDAAFAGDTGLAWITA